VVIVAGRRFGKTVLALVKIITLALLKRKSNIWYIAPTYKQAEMIAWKMLKDMLPRETILATNEVKLSVNLINGSEICLKGAENEDSLRGVGLDFVVLDEYAQMKPNVWDEIIRPMLTDKKGRALFIGTPQGKNILYDLYQRGANGEEGWSSYRFKTIDNPFIDESEVEQAKKQLPEVIYRLEYEASFEHYAGLCYPMFAIERHVINPIELEPYWRTFRSIDYGYINPFACLWFAVSHDGITYVIDEHYEAGKGLIYHAEEMKKRKYSVDYTYIDPSAAAHSREKGGIPYSVVMELNDMGVMAIPASRSDRNVGISRVGELFNTDKIKIFKNCVNLIRELQDYRWKDATDLSVNASEEPVKRNDHAADALRYFVMTREKASEIPEKKPVYEHKKEKSLYEADSKLQEVFEDES
jgi:PBSX family phage terminase large subunit